MDHVSMLHAELARELGRISQLEGEREILGRRTLKLEAELAAEKRAHDAGVTVLDAELALAKRRASEVREQNDELLIELGRVRADRDRLISELARVRTLEQSGSLAAIRDAEEMAERERKRADALFAQNADLHAECERLRADCTRITTEVRDLRVDCARAAEQREELRALLTEALRRHDATPLGEWERAARALVSGPSGGA